MSAQAPTVHARYRALSDASVLGLRREELEARVAHAITAGRYKQIRGLARVDCGDFLALVHPHHGDDEFAIVQLVTPARRRRAG